MPARNDYRCEVCGVWEEHLADDTCRPWHCGQVMVWEPSRPPAVDSYDTHAFDVSHNGQTFHIDSLEKLRAVERLTEQQARNGEGTPLVWRDYAQDRSNTDRHTLARDVTKPLDGYCGEDTHPGQIKVDPKKLQPLRGSQVTSEHGTI